MKKQNPGKSRTYSIMHRLLPIVLLVCSVCFAISCAKTVRVYSPPPFDLGGYGRLGIIDFTDNADPSVSAYATQQFQDQVHSAQTGIPILQMGTEKEVLRRIHADRLDFKAFQKIGREYNVAAVFCGNILYSDIQTDVRLKSVRDLKANVNATLHATLSAQLFETDGGAAVWSNSVSWNRKLGQINVNRRGNISAGMRGYHDAYRKLIPDMAYDVTREFRGRYTLQRIADNGARQ